MDSIAGWAKFHFGQPFLQLFSNVSKGLHICNVSNVRVNNNNGSCDVGESETGGSIQHGLGLWGDWIFNVWALNTVESIT